MFPSALIEAVPLVAAASSVGVLAGVGILYLYLTKKLCFRHLNDQSCWCCKKKASGRLQTTRARIARELVNSFSFANELAQTSDGEVEEIDSLQQVRSHQYNARLGNCMGEHRKYNKLLDYGRGNVPVYGNHHQPSTSISEPITSTMSTAAEANPASSRRYTRPIQRQHSMFHHDDEGYESPNYNNKSKAKNLLKQQAIYTSLALKKGTKSFENMMLTKSSKFDGKQPERSNDLISLAEKGRLGKQISTDGSVTSEAGSAEEAIIDRKGLFKRNKTASSDTTDSKDTTDTSNTQPTNPKYHMLNSFMHDTFESDTQSTNLPDFSPNATLSEKNMSLPLKNGKLEVSFAYDAPTKRLCTMVIQGSDMPLKEICIGVNQIYVKVLLLPNKKQKYRTKPKPIFSPIFNDSFTFNRISPDEIATLGLEFRVYGISFAKKSRVMGTSRILFACMKPQQQETRLWFTLDSHKKGSQTDLRSEASSLARTDSTSSQSLTTVLPEVLIGMTYNGTTGRLNVAVIKGSQFSRSTSRALDTYVKLALISSNGQVIEHCKTSVVRSQPNPDFKETFIFQVALFQLGDVSLMISVYCKRSIKRKVLLGWLSLGCNSTGDEELSHWNDMRDSKGEQICRWHTLLKPT